MHDPRSSTGKTVASRTHGRPPCPAHGRGAVRREARDATPSGALGRLATGLRVAVTALLVALPLGLGVASAQAYDNAQDLMDALDARPEPTTEQATLTMTITGAGGQQLTRSMTMWSAGGGHRLLKFTAPADIAGSGFLILENPDGSDERMVYLPALGRVRRIAGGQQGDAFFGSDFSYEDVTGLVPGDYDATLLEVKEGPVYVVQAVPKPDTGSSYQKLVLEVPEDTLIPSRVEYYRGGEIVKVLTVSDVRQQGDYLLATKRTMQSMSGGQPTSSTVIAESDVVLDRDIPAEVFSERYLRR